MASRIADTVSRNSLSGMLRSTRSLANVPITTPIIATISAGHAAKICREAVAKEIGIRTASTETPIAVAVATNVAPSRSNRGMAADRMPP